MNIVFALLAHGAPRLVERTVRRLLAEGHKVALHYDQKSSDAEYRRLVDSFGDCEAVSFAARVPVRWAEWSVVEAMLSCLDAIEAAGWSPDYVYPLSGADYPIRPSADLVAFLARNNGTEFIESVPADKVLWAKTGPQQERYEYRHYFNWREQPRRCEWSLSLQRVLGLKRKFVRGLAPYMGSQWWVLTWATLQQIRALAREPDILRFFRTTLVPDELFFQTMVRHLVPEARIVSRTLTLYQFTDYGLPVVYYTDHFDYLLRQPFFMARKISPRHDALRDALDGVWRGETPPAAFEDIEIGAVGDEYTRYRMRHRDGLSGRPVAGRVPRPRYGDLERLNSPFFVIYGSCTAELRLVYTALARHPDVLCHGQLFHPRRIEFGESREAFSVYTAADTRLRAASLPNFVSDIVRAERQRLSGMLLRWGQGARIAEVLLECPNARILLLRGDPLVAFSEEILGFDPLLRDTYDASVVETPPSVLADRFDDYLEVYQKYGDWLSERAVTAAPGRPRGAVVEIALATDWSRPAAWLAQIEDWLGVMLPDAADAIAPEVAKIEKQRQLMLEWLTIGGWNSYPPERSHHVVAPQKRPAPAWPRPAWAPLAINSQPVTEPPEV